MGYLLSREPIPFHFLIRSKGSRNRLGRCLMVINGQRGFKSRPSNKSLSSQLPSPVGPKSDGYPLVMERSWVRVPPEPSRLRSSEVERYAVRQKFVQPVVFDPGRSLTVIGQTLTGTWFEAKSSSHELLSVGTTCPGQILPSRGQESLTKGGP